MAFYTNPFHSLIYFHSIFNSNHDLPTNPNLLFDFHVTYTRGPEGNQDFNNLETFTVHQTHEFDRKWLIGGDKAQIQANVYHILDLIDVPSYSEIVHTLTVKLCDLKKLDTLSTIPKVEKVKVSLDVVFWMLPSDYRVKLAVAPASEEAVEKHLETINVEVEDNCVICMDKIRVGSGLAAGRMPCVHVFHRNCVEKWLKNSSGICPVCRTVFPIED